MFEIFGSEGWASSGGVSYSSGWWCLGGSECWYLFGAMVNAWTYYGGSWIPWFCPRRLCTWRRFAVLVRNALKVERLRVTMGERWLQFGVVIKAYGSGAAWRWGEFGDGVSGSRCGGDWEMLGGSGSDGVVGQITDGHLADGCFTDGHLAELTFGWRTFYRADTWPNWHLAEQALGRNDI